MRIISMEDKCKDIDKLKKMNDTFFSAATQMGRTISGNLTHMKLLGLLFIGLKLAGVITWSWFLVLLPYVLSFAGTMISTWSIVAIFAMMLRFSNLVSSMEKDKRVPINE